MKGDGNCGWRGMLQIISGWSWYWLTCAAVAFGYFEHLFSLRDLVLVQNELVRIKSLSSLLEQVGHEEYLYEIFVDATEQVFTQIIQAIQDGVRDDSFLVNAFNVEYSSNAILTHFRVSITTIYYVMPVSFQQLTMTFFLMYIAAHECMDETESPAVSSVYRCSLGSILCNTSRDRQIGDWWSWAAGIGWWGYWKIWLCSGNPVPRPKSGRCRDASSADAQPSQHRDYSTVISAVSSTIPLHCELANQTTRGHYDLLYRPEPTVNMEPVVNFQYAMTSNYSPWDQGALSFDVNSSLMSIPNLMMDPTFAMAPAPMSPAPISPQAPPSPYRVSSPQEVYQQPPMPSPPPPPTSISSPPAPQMSGPPPPLNSLPSRSSEGAQIRLNPLVMKPNLSHSLPVTTPFKKWVFFLRGGVWIQKIIVGIIANLYYFIARRTTKPIFKIKILNRFTGHLTNLANEWILDDLERQYRTLCWANFIFLPFLICRIFFDPVIFSPQSSFQNCLSSLHEHLKIRLFPSFSLLYPISFC